jgi:rRNA maturation endonuclease Nob1
VDVVELKKKSEIFDVDEVTNNTKDNMKEEKLEEDGFVEVKSRKSKNKVKESNQMENWGDEEWITADNINEKLHKIGKISKSEKFEEKTPIKVTIFSSDFTLQNLSLKIGIPIVSGDNMVINKIKHYILKCYSCNTFIFDTEKVFCESCGYTTLMKIGCSINKQGRMRVYDKKAEARLRGTQVILLILFILCSTICLNQV